MALPLLDPPLGSGPIQSWPRQVPTAASLSCLVVGTPQQRWDPCLSLHMVLTLGLLVCPWRGDLPLSQPLGKAGALLQPLRLLLFCKQNFPEHRQEGWRTHTKDTAWIAFCRGWLAQLISL